MFAKKKQIEKSSEHTLFTFHDVTFLATRMMIMNRIEGVRRDTRYIRDVFSLLSNVARAIADGFPRKRKKLGRSPSNNERTSRK